MTNSKETAAGIDIELSTEPKYKNSPVIQQRKKGGASKTFEGFNKMKEMAVIERDVAVWDLVARGYTRRQVADELGIHVNTVYNALTRMTEAANKYIEQNAEDWRTKQLAIYNEEISRSSRDAETRPEPVLNENGEQVHSRNGAPKWIISPMEAAKIRDMGGRRLIQALQQQARLLGLLVQRHEVQSENRTLVVVKSDFGENIIDMV